MNDDEIEAAVQWFRQGLKDELSKDVEKSNFSYATPWWIKGAYESGLLLAEQMQCEATGHKDEVWHTGVYDGMTSKYFYEESRMCYACDRFTTKVIALFDSKDELNAYSRELWKKREAEKA